MLDKKQVKLRVQKALETLFRDGTRSEHIAVSLEMSNASVQNWAKGRRVPKIPTIRQIEQIYRIHILSA